MRGLTPEILELQAAQNEIAAELSFVSPLLERYILPSSKGSPAGFAGHLPLTGPEGSGTASAFCAFFLARSGALLQAYATPALLKSLTLQVKARCIKALELPIGASPAARVSSEPNNYKLPIYLAGIAALISLGRITASDGLDAIQVGLKLLRARLNDNTIGALARVGAYARREPSACHTYWAAQALTEIVSSDILVASLKRTRALQPAESFLSVIRAWAESALAALIADHHAGITARFDPIELVCAASLASLKLEHSHKGQFVPSNEALRLAGHGLQILFAEHFSDGSLARSKPVYSDEEKNPIFCSTPEALFYLLAPSVPSSSPVGSSEVGSSMSVTVRPHVGSLLKAFRLLRSSRTTDGYLPDLDGAFGIEPSANAFSTFAGACFLVRAAAVIDDVLDDLAREQLHLPAFVRDAEIASREYPKRLSDILKHYVVTPLKSGRRKEAYYSIILHGPPGTAKTTLAKRLSQDLEWPLLEITQRDFLVDGTAFIDAAADRIFSLVGFMKNVVVLFDELEELIGSRESSERQHPERETRLLTTSMLPRIHELRDKERIVFIFATNRIKSFDVAAIRPGRFDIIQLVPPPEVEQLERYFKVLVDKLPAPRAGADGRQARKLRSDAEKVLLKAGMTYKDVALCFNDLRRQVLQGDKDLHEEDLERLVDDFVSIECSVAERFRRLSESFDRP